jgi:hypothetical protein
MTPTYHTEYKQNIYNWSLVRDCVQGEAAVKRKNTLYLPIPSGMINAQSADSYIGNYSTYGLDNKRNIELYNPNKHTNPAYQAYLHRAHLPGMTDHTLRGLLGIAMRKHPTVSLPSSLQYMIGDATMGHLSLINLFIESVSEVLQTGRCGLGLDVDDMGQIKFVMYKAEDIMNWDYDKKLNKVLLKEEKLEDWLSDECYEEYKILEIEDGVFTVSEFYADNSEPDEVTVPVVMGRPLGELPFKIVGALTNEPNVDPAPLLPVALTALQIYMKNADLSQAEYLTCNPTLIITGASPDEAPVTTGSTVAIVLNDPMSKVYYTETDSSGMTHLLKHIEKLSDEASQHGASLIAQQKGEKESGDALRIRQAASTSTLHSVVNTVGDAIESLLKTASNWMGIDSSQILFEPNTEFSESGLDAGQMMSLMNAYLNGGISLETLVDNFRRSGMLQSGDDTSTELSRLKAQSETQPVITTQPMTTTQPEGGI